ncbi:MAG: hypothetical protein ACFFCQ_11000 [Promethearchaeota archaeon]
MSQPMSVEEVYQFTRSAIKSIAEKLTSRMQTIEKQVEMFIKQFEDQLSALQANLESLKPQYAATSDFSELNSRLVALEQMIGQIQGTMINRPTEVETLSSESSSLESVELPLETTESKEIEVDSHVEIISEEPPSLTDKTSSQSILPSATKGSSLSELTSDEDDEKEPILSLSGLKKVAALSGELATQSSSESASSVLDTVTTSVKQAVELDDDPIPQHTPEATLESMPEFTSESTPESTPEFTSEYSPEPSPQPAPESEPLSPSSSIVQNGEENSDKKDTKKMKQDLDRALRLIDSL